MRRLLPAILAIVLVAPSVARADDPAPPTAADVARAKDLFDRASESMQRGRFSDAIPDLREALALTRKPAVAFNLAVSLRGTGDSLAAMDLFDALLRGEYGELEPARVTEVRALRADVEKDLASLTIAVTGADEADVRIDGDKATTLHPGEVAQRRVNPGRHRILASARDKETVDRTVDLARGAADRVTLDLRPAPDRRPGHLVVSCDDASATLSIEGVAVGRGKLDRDLAPGDYDVVVRTGSGERRVRVTVPAGRRVGLTLDAPSRPLLSRPAFWIVTSIVVTGGAVGTVLAVRAAKKDAVGSPVWGITTASAPVRWP